MKKMAVVVMCVLLLAAACGGSDDEPEVVATDDAASSQAEGQGDASDDQEASDEAEAAPEEDAASSEAAAPAAAPAAPSGGARATLTLANGEVFEFGLLCTLEPQVAAGSEILFTAVSYDDPYNLDITQFGENDFDGLATVSVYDSSTYDTVWEASSGFGGDLTLGLDGSTITGSGSFLAGGELGGESVQGEIVAAC
jgi:hypothetical protein